MFTYGVINNTAVNKYYVVCLLFVSIGTILYAICNEIGSDLVYNGKVEDLITLKYVTLLKTWAHDNKRLKSS